VNFLNRRLAAVTMMVVALSLPVLAHAATNQGTGDVAGDAAALAPSNVFDLSSQQLALVKRAFLANGSQITSGSTVPRGTEVRFLIYVNNTTAFEATDLSVQDVLAGTFAYQAGTLKVDMSVPNCALGNCTPAEEAAIYASVNGQAVSTDAVDGDLVSITGATIDAGNQAQANAQLNVPANRVFAMLLTVRMQ
jgi:uncharacterized repeat protein (TIGR01451 family)